MALDDLLAILNGMVRKLRETTDQALRVEISMFSLRIQRLEMASRAIKKTCGSWIGFDLSIKNRLQIGTESQKSNIDLCDALRR